MDLLKKFDELGRAWEEGKATLSKDLNETKSETKEKFEKINADMDKIQAKIDAVNAAMTRTAAGKEGTDESKAQREYKKAFEQYIRYNKNVPDDVMEMARKTLSIDSEVNGGFFVEPELAAEIVKAVNESSPIRQLASVQGISSSSLKINEDVDARSASWVGEQQSRSNTTTPTLKQVEIHVHEMYTYPKATTAFLDDASVNVEAWLSDWASEAFALTEATAFVRGDGVGKPRGILSYADGTVFGYVQRIATDATGAVTGLDLIDVQDALKEPYQRNATWLMSRAVRGAVRKVTDGTNFLWQPGLQQGVPELLLGKPIMLAQDMTATASFVTGLDVAMYGDFKAGYQIVDRRGIRVLRNPYTNAGFVSFDTSMRVGGGVKNFEAIKIMKVM